MNQEQLQSLWEARFQRLVKLETEAVVFYKILLQKYPHVLNGSRAKQIIRRIMREEGQHVKIAKKLLSIVECKRKR